MKGDGEVLRIKSEERAVEARIAHAVAGFDLTFSAQKGISASKAHAIAGNQALIYGLVQQVMISILAPQSGYSPPCPSLPLV